MDDEFWDKYVSVEFDEKIIIIEELLSNSSEIDPELIFDVFDELNKSTSTKEERETFNNSVGKLKRESMLIYIMKMQLIF